MTNEPIRHVPRRDDDVAQWLRARRDAYSSAHPSWGIWQALDDLLDEYRTRADYGLRMTDELPDPG